MHNIGLNPPRICFLKNKELGILKYEELGLKLNWGSNNFFKILELKLKVLLD
jgi:hypothetical protein